ncbi:MAG: HAMP domain-containing histidine kinase [bacterium]|nr:HAMP domain-containing histidine kinase [bacterium]
MINNLSNYISNNYELILNVLKENKIIGFLVIEISNSNQIKELYGKEFYNKLFSLIINFIYNLKGKVYRSEDLVFINDLKDNQIVILLISKPRKKEELDMYNLKIAAVRIISEIKYNLFSINEFKEIIKNIIDSLSYGYCIIKYDDMKDIKDIIFDAFRESYIRQKFDELNDKIISMVSHELRTPLTSIKGFAETIIQEDLEKPEILKFVNIIYNEADRLNRLVNSLLNLSRLESAKVNFNIKKIDIKEIIENVIELMYPKMKNSNIKLNRDYDDDIIYEVLADEDKTEQIIINLIDNAIKYSPKGGTITIGIENRETEVLVYIKDTGIGIPENEKSRIFEKFYRTTISSSITQGTGLGLVITKYLTEGQGGKIWFDSQENIGTTFYFTLPKPLN